MPDAVATGRQTAVRQLRRALKNSVDNEADRRLIRRSETIWGDECRVLRWRGFRVEAVLQNGAGDVALYLRRDMEGSVPCTHGTAAIAEPGEARSPGRRGAMNGLMSIGTVGKGRRELDYPENGFSKMQHTSCTVGMKLVR